MLLFRIAFCRLTLFGATSTFLAESHRAMYYSSNHVDAEHTHNVKTLATVSKCN